MTRMRDAHKIKQLHTYTQFANMYNISKFQCRRFISLGCAQTSSEAQNKETTHDMMRSESLNLTSHFYGDSLYFTLKDLWINCYILP